MTKIVHTYIISVVCLDLVGIRDNRPNLIRAGEAKALRTYKVLGSPPDNLTGLYNLTAFLQRVFLIFQYFLVRTSAT